MGLFDHVRCELPIPVEWDAPYGWQTKEFDCLMDSYVITDDGRLMLNLSDGSSEEVPFHGDLEFHNYDRDRGSLSVTARFTEGRFARMWHEWEPPYARPNAAPPKLRLSGDTPPPVAPEKGEEG